MKAKLIAIVCLTMLTLTACGIEQEDLEPAQMQEETDEAADEEASDEETEEEEATSAAADDSSLSEAMTPADETLDEETDEEEITDEDLAREEETQDAQGILSSFQAYDLDGVERDETMLAEYPLTMVNIWGTFCGPCLQEMPSLGEIAEEYADQGVQVVGIVVDILPYDDGTYDEGTLEYARSLVEQTGANYIHLLPSEDLVNAKLQEVNAVPETFFLDEKGNQVGESYLGARSKEEWIQIIDSLR